MTAIYSPKKFSFLRIALKETTSSSSGAVVEVTVFASESYALKSVTLSYEILPVKEPLVSAHDIGTGPTSNVASLPVHDSAKVTVTLLPVVLKDARRFIPPEIDHLSAAENPTPLGAVISITPDLGTTEGALIRMVRKVSVF
jgi:hypothetical protein